MSDTALLTPEDVAVRLKVKESTLAAWRRGVGPGSELPFIKVGASIRYRESDLANWLASRTRDGDA